jgi:F-type H+-transporting ATPase subunit b
MLDINPGLIIWTLITFVLLILLLSKLAWKPLLGALQAREQGIADALSQADEARKESERVLNENKAALAKANEETARLIAEGRIMAEQVKNDIIAKANENAKSLIAQAKDEINREKEAALIQLRSEVADLAIAVAEKIVDETLDGAKQKKFVDKVLQQMPKN